MLFGFPGGGIGLLPPAPPEEGLGPEEEDGEAALPILGEDAPKPEPPGARAAVPINVPPAAPPVSCILAAAITGFWVVAPLAASPAMAAPPAKAIPAPTAVAS
ncbi:hypothetical protein HF563_07820, partial [Acidithiobacillus ferridurans]|nr:hypothetical protein [Acidithiobacillus ferridurans]